MPTLIVLSETVCVSTCGVVFDMAVKAAPPVRLSEDFWPTNASVVRAACAVPWTRVTDKRKEIDATSACAFELDVESAVALRLEPVTDVSGPTYARVAPFTDAVGKSRLTSAAASVSPVAVAFAVFMPPAVSVAGPASVTVTKTLFSVASAFLPR